MLRPFYRFFLIIGLVATGLVTGLADGVSLLQAQSLAQIKHLPKPAKACPNVHCPNFVGSEIKSGQSVPVYEHLGGYVRITRYVDRQSLVKKFPEADLSKAPERIAAWVPAKFLALGGDGQDAQPPSSAKKRDSVISSTATATTQKSAAGANVQIGKNPVDDQEKEAKIALREKQLALVRKILAQKDGTKSVQALKQAEGAPGDRVSLFERFGDTDSKTGSVPETATNSKDKILKQNAAASAKSEDEKTPRLSASKMAESKIDRIISGSIAKPKQPQGRPQGSLSDWLDDELRDQRLSNLPDRPVFGLTIPDIIAIRSKALAMLESGACSRIKSGGRASSNSLFVQCAQGNSNDGNGIERFSRPEQVWQK